MPSTIIRRFDYRPDERLLDILFTTGRRYLYRDVPPEAAEAFRQAFNKGRHFNSRIRNLYPYREIEAEAGDEDLTGTAPGVEQRFHSSGKDEP